MTTGTLKVLIVDDNDMASELLSEFVSLLGHEVSTSATGADGLAACMAQRPRVVITDIVLPDFDGYELARRIRGELGHGVRLIALSGLPRNSDRPETAHFDAWLEKPVDLAALEQMLAEQAGNVA
jgi:CheY-like chemotaxis protein